MLEMCIEYLPNYNKEAWGEVYSKEGDSGYDLRAAIDEDIVLQPGDRKLIPTGIKVQLQTVLHETIVKLKGTDKVISREPVLLTMEEIFEAVKQFCPAEELSSDLFEQLFACEIKSTPIYDSNYEIQVRPRSGLAVKYGISVVNTPGTVDHSYRGEICVILINHSREDFEIKAGDRIAQMVVCPIVKPKIVEVESVDETDRGAKGFGSSGV